MSLSSFDEYRSHDATSLAELVRQGVVCSTELIEIAIARAEDVNPKINALVTEPALPVQVDYECTAAVEQGARRSESSGLPPKLGDLSLSQPYEEFIGAASSASAFTSLFNMTGQPAMSVPLYATAAGLPIGVMFAGRFGDARPSFVWRASSSARSPGSIGFLRFDSSSHFATRIPSARWRVDEKIVPIRVLASGS